MKLDWKRNEKENFWYAYHRDHGFIARPEGVSCAMSECITPSGNGITAKFDDMDSAKQQCEHWANVLNESPTIEPATEKPFTPPRFGKKVYVAGPYTAPTDELIEQNVKNALHAGEQLADAGFWPIIPHLVHMWHKVYPRNYEFWMQLDFALVRDCDALLRLEGSSKGADREVELADSLGIPVFHAIQDAVTYYETGAGRNILDRAKALIFGERQADYGHPSDNWNDITEGWTWRLKYKLKPGERVTQVDGVDMMSIMKKARRMRGTNKRSAAQSREDDIGYVALEERFDEKEPDVKVAWIDTGKYGDPQ